MRRLVLLALAASFCPMVASAVDVSLDDMRKAVDKYKDVKVALADGYITPDNHCVSAANSGLPAELGAMGIHYIHPALLEITGTDPKVDGKSTHTDWMKPSVLIYEPQADGSLELVAVENLVFQAAWDAAAKSEELVLNSRAWDHMADDPATEGDEAHGFTPHYDQHVWLYRTNPAGDLMPFNPAVTCDHAPDAHKM
jgi:hypothetical protein